MSKSILKNLTPAKLNRPEELATNLKNPGKKKMFVSKPLSKRMVYYTAKTN